MPVFRAPRSLRFRLLAIVAASVIVVIGIEGYVELVRMERAAKDDLLEMGRLAGQAVASDVEQRADPLAGVDLENRLVEFVEAYPAIRAITVVRAGDQTPTIEASTLTQPPTNVLAIGRSALERGDVVLSESGTPLWWVGVPVRRDGQEAVDAAVVVGVSFASLERLWVEAWIATLWFAPAAIVVLVVVIDWTMRRLVFRPIGMIVDTVQRAGRGNLKARAPVERADELGAIATGLNTMLADLERYHTRLQARVDDATGELKQRNQDLVDSYQRMFLVRETLAKAEQMALVGQMAAASAHQIGTPLNLISGYVQLMMQQTTDPQALTRLRHIETQVSKVTTAVRTMLDTARRPVTFPEVVDLAHLVRTFVDTARPVLEAGGITFSLTVGDGVAPIRLDPAQFELVLFNLMSNSLDAMPTGGSIRVSLEPTTRGVRLTFADSGTGIAPELLPHVFDAWVTTKAPGKGTGLGLSIVRDVVQTRGGTIVAQSEPGVGTTFVIDLPLAAESLRTGTLATAAGRAGIVPGGRPMSVS